MVPEVQIVPVIQFVIHCDAGSRTERYCVKANFIV
jgi:hypothetical protein